MLAAVLNSGSDAALAGGALRYCRAREAWIGQVADRSFKTARGLISWECCLPSSMPPQQTLEN